MMELNQLGPAVNIAVGATVLVGTGSAVSWWIARRIDNRIKEEVNHMDRLQSIENRVTRVEEKMDHMATKEDLAEMEAKMDGMATKEDLAEMESKMDGMATKEDLTGMVTKEDLTGMAAKEDLTGMATREDLTRMATKEDLSTLKTDLIQIFENVNGKAPL